MFRYVRLISGASLLVSGFLCGLALSRPSIGQSPDQVPKMEALPVAEALQANEEIANNPKVHSWATLLGKGRYQVMGTGGLSYSIVIDTVTGRCWALYPTAGDPNLAADGTLSKSAQNEAPSGQSAAAPDQNEAPSGQAAAGLDQKAASSDQPKTWVPLGRPPGAE